MAALKKRLATSIVLSIFSLISIVLLLPRRHMDRLQKIALGGTVGVDLGFGVWDWGSDGEGDEGARRIGGGIGETRVVVFGDAWIDGLGGLEEEKEKGKSWVEVLCDELNTTNLLTLTNASYASDSHHPTGAATSHAIHVSALRADQSIPLSSIPSSTPLMDLTTQVETFISLPAPSKTPTQTLFVLSTGFWDIYTFSSLELPIAQNATDRSIDEVFRLLDKLYLHYVTALYPTHPSSSAPKANATTDGNKDKSPAPGFKVIIPRLFDPTLMPGWLSQRPEPKRPSSVAEEQKNAVYLVERWNSIMENRMGGWISTTPNVPGSGIETAPLPPKAASTPIPLDVMGEKEKNKGDTARADVRHPEASGGSAVEESVNKEAQKNKKLKVMYPEKDIFYHDTPTYLLSVIVEHNLEHEEISDANGLGKGSSPYESVYAPCVRDADADAEEDAAAEKWAAGAGVGGLKGRRVGMVEKKREEDGLDIMMCDKPQEFLFWDAWTLGPRARREVGVEIAGMVRDGMGLRRAWEGSREAGES